MEDRPTGGATLTSMTADAQTGTGRSSDEWSPMRGAQVGWIMMVGKSLTTSFLAGWAPSTGLLEHSQHLSSMDTDTAEPQETPQAAIFLSAHANG